MRRFEKHNDTALIINNLKGVKLLWKEKVKDRARAASLITNKVLEI